MKQQDPSIKSAMQSLIQTPIFHKVGSYISIKITIRLSVLCVPYQSHLSPQLC